MKKSLISRIETLEARVIPRGVFKPPLCVIFSDNPAHFEPGATDQPPPDAINAARRGDQLWKRADNESAQAFCDRVTGSVDRGLIFFSSENK